MTALDFQIMDLHTASDAAREEAASLLHLGFRDSYEDAWPDMESAREEVAEACAPEKIIRAAVDSDGHVLGWIGAMPFYALVWELHPMVVRADVQGRGIGRALVHDLEAQVAERGGLTLYLGTDDDTDRTSLSGVDLYPNPLDHLQRIQNRSDHPFTFYQQLGFAVVGVVPDANGFGKPDILMAKRVTAPNNP